MTVTPARTPPRLVTRVVVTSLLPVALLLAAVFILLSLDVRDRVRQSVIDNLSSAQLAFTRAEARRELDTRSTVSTLAENPTLKAALDTWLTERAGANQTTLNALIATVQHEADKLADGVSSDVLAITDQQGRVVVSAGPRAAAWPRGAAAGVPAGDASISRAVTLGDAVFRVVSVDLQLQDAAIGRLSVGTALDDRYARELAVLSRGQAAILRRGQVLASTLAPPVVAALAAHPDASLGLANVVDLGGEAWAVQPLSQVGDVRMLSLVSIDAIADRDTSAALTQLAWIALGAVSLAILATVWLARTLARPIDALSASLQAMAAVRASEPIAASGTSRELDQLTDTFNSLMASRAAAEAEAEATYLGAVRALAAALDARDSFTAGHSERVSALSVAIGRELALDADALEVLRLGALLHDVGKIGVADEILRKPGALTASEFDAIRAHPSAGARILRSIPFLARHIPIVELHHERLDGRGYPYGLVGAAIPEAARIVHVADAFDAMTSARAYRTARLPVEAIAELRRCAGTDFDGAAVEALVAALPGLATGAGAPDAPDLSWPRAASA